MMAQAMPHRPHRPVGSAVQPEDPSYPADLRMSTSPDLARKHGSIRSLGEPAETKAAMALAWIKVGGVTTLQDALSAEAAGADAVGLSLIPGDPRAIRLDEAAEIAARVALEVVLLVATNDASELRRLALTVESTRFQFESNFPGDEQELPLPGYRAIRFEGRPTLARLREIKEDRFLLRISSERLPGGVLHRQDPMLLKEVGRSGRCVLAGQIDRTNLAAALRFARPWGLDLDTQGEAEPGVKDPAELRELIRLARSVT
jgi:phosphoribosylanthranilate isomerase